MRAAHSHMYKSPTCAYAHACMQPGETQYNARIHPVLRHQGLVAHPETHARHLLPHPRPILQEKNLKLRPPFIRGEADRDKQKQQQQTRCCLVSSQTPNARPLFSPDDCRSLICRYMEKKKRMKNREKTIVISLCTSHFSPHNM